MKKQAHIKIINDNEVNVKIKQWSKVPRDFWNIIERVVKLMGKGDRTQTQEYVLDNLNTVRLDIFDIDQIPESLVVTI